MQPCRACETYLGKTVRHRDPANCWQEKQLRQGVRVRFTNGAGRKSLGTVVWHAKTGNVMVEIDGVTNSWGTPYRCYIRRSALEIVVPPQSVQSESAV